MTEGEENTAAVILNRLRQWSSTVGAREYPISELYKALTFNDVPTLDTIEKSVRRLYARRQVDLIEEPGREIRVKLLELLEGVNL